MITLTKPQKIGIVVLTIGILGFVGYKIYKKKKGSSTTSDTDLDTDDGSTTSSNGIIYTGLTTTQTRTLQTKLNSFISSGKLGMVLGWLGILGAVKYQFKMQDGKPYYSTDGKKWYQYYKGYSGNPKAMDTAYGLWLVNQNANKVNQVTNVVTNNTSDTNTSVVVPTGDSSTALSTFKSSIASNLTNGKLKVDGAYGKNTKAVVMALQIYLNTVKGSGLNVDGYYGQKTDTATGWRICS